jgi:hypothetical protein
MKTLRALLGVSAAALALGALVATFPASRGFALPGAASASASASASAAPVKKPLRQRPALATIDIPTDKSPFPKDAEWKDAKLVQPTRNANSRGCDLEILREYARVHCSVDVPVIRQYAGDIDDVETRVEPKGPQMFSNGGGHATFPLRKGHGHVFEFFETESEYNGSSAEPSFVVDAYWPESDKQPTIVIRGPGR